MLDPLSGLALAAAVAQFIDFTWKVVTRSEPIFSKTSSSAKKDELVQVADQLRQLSKRMQADDVISHESGVFRTSETCRKIEEELTGLLTPITRKIKMDFTGKVISRKWATVRQVIGSKPGGDKKIVELERKLDILRQELILAILVELRSYSHIYTI
jgi:hypothetical protein